jgi:hypothetical protein
MDFSKEGGGGKGQGKYDVKGYPLDLIAKYLQMLVFPGTPTLIY